MLKLLIGGSVLALAISLSYIDEKKEENVLTFPRRFSNSMHKNAYTNIKFSV
jgi:hypothetical protein